MKNLTLIILIAIISTSVDAQDSLQTGGLKIPTPEGLNTIFLGIPRAGAATFDGNGALPPAIDLSEYLPKPGNQLSQASCSAWAVAYGLKSFYQAAKGKYKLNTLSFNDISTKTFSPSFIYNQVHNKDEPCNSGIFLKDALIFLQNNGAALWSDMPYKDEDCKSDPPASLKEKAKEYAIANFTPIYYLGDIRISTFVDLTVFRRSLANGYPEITKGNPIVVGVHLDKRAINKDFDLVNHNGKQIKMWNIFLGGTLFNNASYHAMLCVGYDQDLNAFKFLNSWGDNGSDGYLWLADQVVERAVKEAYIVEDLIDTGRNRDLDKTRNMNLIDRSTSLIIPRKNNEAIYDLNILASVNNQINEYTNHYKINYQNKGNANDTTFKKKNSDTTLIVTSINKSELINNNFIVSSWFKKGYYRDFGTFRIGLSDIKKKRCCIIVRFTDLKTERELAKFTASYEQPVNFGYNNQNFTFLYKNLAKRGINPFKSKAAYFTFTRSYGGRNVR